MCLTTPQVGVWVASHYQTHDYICNKKNHTEIKIINCLIVIQVPLCYKTASVFRAFLDFGSVYKGFCTCTFSTQLCSLHFVSLSFLHSAGDQQLAFSLGFISPQPSSTEPGFYFSPGEMQKCN